MNKTEGHVRGPNYTKEEDDYIKDNYKNMSRKEIGEFLGRNEKSVQHRAEKLGVRNIRKREWTTNEDQYILKCYREGMALSEVSKSLDRDMSETSKRAKKLGVIAWRRDEEGRLFDYKGYEVVAFKSKAPPVMVHRSVVEKEIGRKLSSDEIVHHIDMDVKNNDISNLYLCNKSVHASCHWSLKRCLKENENPIEMIQKGKILFDRKTGKYIRI